MPDLPILSEEQKLEACRSTGLNHLQLGDRIWHAQTGIEFTITEELLEKIIAER